jgi:hypothetical protein
MQFNGEENCSCMLKADVLLSLVSGGRIFVIGIYLGLLASLVTTFFAINVYMSLSAKISEESPYFSTSIVHWMDMTIFSLYTRSYVIILVLALAFMYICV